MNDTVIAFFITWTTYGSWLPGDRRGWASKKVLGIQEPNPELEQECRERMMEDAVTLMWAQRQIVDAVIVEHCRIRGWKLHARNARTNHVHIVVTADCDGETVREQLKGWCSRRLSDHAGLPAKSKHGRRRWFTEGGDLDDIFDEDHLQNVIEYVIEGQ